MRFLYRAALYLSIPLVLLRLLWRGARVPAYRHRWSERFGRLPAGVPGEGIWIHAVSVGEVRAAALLVDRLKVVLRGCPILVTSTTATGSGQVRTLFGDSVHHAYAPYDLPFAVRRFLDRCRPRALVIMETELWPTTIELCQRRGIPVMLANARLSERSAAGYGRVPGFTRDMLRRISVIAAQTPQDASRFIGLGARPDRVQVTGSMKFDLRLPASLHEAGEALRRDWGVTRPVLIAASTHEGEEELVLAAFARIRQSFNNALLVLVPRHPERFDRVAALCAKYGFAVVRRSSGALCSPGTAVYLADTMGELNLLYAAGDVAFVGGSLVPVGGHNVLEPAARGMPVLFGPHTFNFEGACSLLLARGGARQVTEVPELATAAIEWLEDANLRHAAGEQAQAVVEDNRGAVDAQLQMVIRLCDPG